MDVSTAKFNSINSINSRNFGNINKTAITTLGITSVVTADDIIKCDRDGEGIALTKPQMSLLEYSRTFYIGSIPFMDFIFAYIIIYFINHYFIKASVKKTLIAAIPVTIIVNIFINKKFRVDMGTLVIFIICVLLLVT